MALTAVLAAPALAVLDFQQNLAWKYYFIVDWSSSTTVANHLNYSVWPAAEHPRGVSPKYIDFDLTSSFLGTGRGNCFELATQNGPSGTAADTEILVRQDNGVWARLSDDTPGSANSKARIMFELNVQTTQDHIDLLSRTKIRIAAYSEFHNSEDFWVSLTYIGALTEPECTGDVSKAAVYIRRDEKLRIIRAI